MNAFLASIDWLTELNNPDVNSSAQTLTHILIYAIDQFVPKRAQQPTRIPPWSNNELKRAKSAKRSSLKKYSKNPSLQNKISYGSLNNRYKRMNNSLRSAYLNKIQSDLKSNPKKFWDYVNKQRNECGLPTTMFLGDTEGSNTLDICNLFKTHFRSVFSDESIDQCGIVSAASNVPNRSVVGPHPTITVSTITTACAKLKRSSNPGPDGVPSVILKKCVSSIALPLAIVFNQSLCSGTFPTIWKKSFLFPVFKKGKKSSICNYRGIAALCAASKLFELIVLDFIKHNCSAYISNTQHGFMEKRSTSTNLVSYTTFVTQAMQDRHQVDAIYTDFSAAFDKINHNIAIAKLGRLGFSGTFLRWLESYLVQRTMSVKIGDTISSSFQVTSGVPQGSHLGPFIFLLYLNDVNLILKCQFISYADDYKLYHIIKEPKDTDFLQLQLNNFTDWCTKNRMALNASKCSVISFSRKRSNIESTYFIDQTPISRVLNVKDLGIILDSKLSYRDHISYIASKASKSLGFIFRVTKNFKNIHCLKALYCALVRSHLEYAVPVWAPYYQNGIDRLESIQRKFVRYALRFLPWNDPSNLPSYHDRCKLIGLDTLDARRNSTKAQFVADLLQNRIDCPTVLSSLNINVRNHYLRFQSFFRLPFARTNYALNNPVRSMIRVFNLVSSLFDFHIPRNRLKKLFIGRFSQASL